jgi:hypothetical protein
MTGKESPNFIERFTVRMPDGLRDAVAERAKRNGRSMNSEIINMIEEAIKRDSIIDGALKEHADIKLDESKASELELLQEQIIAIQKSENALLKRKVEILSRLSGDDVPT